MIELNSLTQLIDSNQLSDWTQLTYSPHWFNSMTQWLNSLTELNDLIDWTHWLKSMIQLSDSLTQHTDSMTHLNSLTQWLISTQWLNSLSQWLISTHWLNSVTQLNDLVTQWLNEWHNSLSQYSNQLNDLIQSAIFAFQCVTQTKPLCGFSVRVKVCQNSRACRFEFENLYINIYLYF